MRNIPDLITLFPKKPKSDIVPKSSKKVKLIKFSLNNLQNLRAAAHFELDKLWQLKILYRNDVYHELARYLGIKREKTHISLFDEHYCRKTIEFAKWQLKTFGIDLTYE